MYVVSLIGAAQAFFFSLLALKKDKKTKGDRILSAWLAFMGLHLLGYYIHSAGLTFQYPHLLALDYCFPMLHGPFMFIYVSTMIRKTGGHKWTYLLHGLPFLLFMTYFFFDFYLLGADEKLAYYKAANLESQFAHIAVSIFNNYLGPIYLIWTFVLLSRHRKSISENFSYTEDIDFKWLRYLLVWFVGVWGVVILTELFPAFSIDEGLAPHLIYLSLTIAIFFIGYFGIKQQAIYSPMPTQKHDFNSGKEVKPTPGPSGRYEHSGLKKAEAKAYLEELLRYMEEEKPYLNEKLTLQDVASHLSISTHHVSQIINEGMGVNFFDLVNQYRVEEVKRQIAASKHEQLTLLGVAYDSGFNSKSCFNRIFKKFTDQTPSEYIRSLKD